MKKRVRVLALLLVVVFVITGTNLTVFAKETESGENVIVIKKEKDWNELARRCKKNTDSEGMTVHLKKDLTLSKNAKMIPYFAGIFDGGGHTITGEKISREESDLALFGETGESANISKLNVSLKIIGEESQENVGGIVGTNGGTVMDCTYTGIVSGEKNVGGIAANNEKSGQIIRSSVSGIIAGQNKTGGIVGNNQGTVYQCKNQASVNISVTDEGVQLSSVEKAFYKTWKEETLEELVPSSSDTGGICGYSTGIIKECNNEGQIGYSHVGYNVGGIVGRQSGYVGNCKNTGNIRGRKDVGGIVGQAVPDVTLVYGEDTIANMRSTLNQLQSLMKQTTQDADQASKTVTSRLNQVSDYVDVAMDSTDNIYGHIDDSMAMNSAIISDASARAKSYVQRMGTVTGNLSEASQKMEHAQTELNHWYQNYKNQMGELQETEEVNKTVSKVQTTSGGLIQNYAVNDMNWDNVENWNSEDWEQLKDLLEKLDKGLDILTNAAQDKQLDEAIKEMREASSLMSDAVYEADSIVNELGAEEEVSLEQPDKSFYDETDRLNGAIYGISDQLSLLNQEMSGESSKLIKDVDSISEQFSVLMDLFIQAFSDVTNFNIDDIYVDASDEEIATTTQGKIAGGTNKGQIEGDVNVGGIVGTMAIEYAEDPEDDLDESKSNKFNVTYQTKVIVENGLNEGEVVGKKNCVGAVVGRMDMGTITGCFGSGIIQSTTGDYVGGICGYALSGIRNSDSKAVLKGRDYVGGIAGMTSGDISDSNSMSGITEYQRYAGAIAGDAEQISGISNCHYVSDTLAGIDRIDYASVAEEVTYEELKALTADTDFFTKFTVAFCLDECLEKEEAREENQNQKVIETREVLYGDTLRKSDYPEPEEKKGYYVVWNQDAVTVQGLTVVSGKYVAYDTLLESEVRDKDGRPIVIVEGQFDNKDCLYVENGLLSDEKNEKKLFKEAGGFLWRIRYKKLVAEYTIRVPDDGKNKHVVRIRTEDTDKSYVVLIKKDDTWNRIKTKTSGHHLLVPVTENQVEIAVLENRFK